MRVLMEGKGIIENGAELGLRYHLTPWMGRDVGTGRRGTAEGEEHATRRASP
jgi:hypothetical protein